MVLVIAGTRPEAIKIAPVALAAGRIGVPFAIEIAATGQHGDIVTETLSSFGLRPHHVLDCVRPTGRLPELLSVLVASIGDLLRRVRPVAVVVQGDTSSALAGALAAFYEQVAVIHLEAGLLTSTVATPFPEEAHRRLISDITRLHLAPTSGAASNLLARGVDSADVVITGNTVVDALMYVVDHADLPPCAEVVALARTRARLVVVTAHRRESWGRRMDEIARALVMIAERHSDVLIVVVRHPNPNVSQTMDGHVSPFERIVCIDPLPYPDFAKLLALSCLVLTDSGGMQEELPSLGVRTLVLRDETERPEAMLVGAAVLAGTHHDRIVELASAALSPGAPEISRVNPFGDGQAGRRAVEAIAWLLGRGSRPQDFRPSDAPVDSSDGPCLDAVLLGPPGSPS